MKKRWRACHHRLAVALAVSVLGMLVVCATAAGDPPGPFATISGSVAPGSSQTFNASPVTGSHTSVMVRVTILAGTSLAAGSVVNESFFPPFGFSAGNVQWLPTSVSYGPGDSPGFSVDNFRGTMTASFTAQFYDVPAAPATYSGTSVYDSTSQLPQDSDLDFVVPGTAQYVADLSLLAER